MSRMIQCDVGHFYDTSVNRGCPHCGLVSGLEDSFLPKAEPEDSPIRRAEPVIPGYSIGKELGRGTSGVVFSATSYGGDRVAIKRFDIRKGSRESKAISRFFAQEAKLVSHIKHAHIVKYLETGEDSEGAPFIVISPLAAETLEQRIDRRGSLSAKEVAALLDQIGPALDYLHQHGILHRDIKPSNILFDEKGESYISDFGIAHFAPPRDNTVAEWAVTPGTPEFLAPEVMNAAPNTSASDIYSLALTIYFALCQKLPSDGKSLHLRNVDRIAGELVALSARNPSISNAVSNVVMKSLAPDPKTRYKTAVGFSVAFANGESGSATADTLTPTVAAQAQYHTKPWLEYWKVIIIPVLVAVIGGLTAWLKK